jgi:hypothetical protein
MKTGRMPAEFAVGLPCEGTPDSLRRLGRGVFDPASPSAKLGLDGVLIEPEPA